MFNFFLFSYLSAFRFAPAVMNTISRQKDFPTLRYWVKTWKNFLCLFMLPDGIITSTRGRILSRFLFKGQSPRFPWLVFVMMLK